MRWSPASAPKAMPRACGWICSQQHLHRLAAFAPQHGGLARIAVFFRGQLLEMMRRAARHCRNLPGDGETFNDERVRDRFFRAVLIAGTLWGARIYSDRLSLVGGIECRAPARSERVPQRG